MSESNPYVIDNRGPDDAPFGFIQDPEERWRLGFNYEGGEIKVWDGNWGPVPHRDLKPAMDQLSGRFGMKVVVRK